MTNKNDEHKVMVGDTVIVNRHTHGVKLGVATVTSILPGDEVNLIVHDHRGAIPLESVPWTESESGDGWMTREQAAPFFAAQRQVLSAQQGGPPPTHPSGYRDAPAGSDPRTTRQSLPQISAASTRPLPGVAPSSAGGPLSRADRENAERERTDAEKKAEADRAAAGASSTTTTR